jgi:surface antigen
MKKRILSIAVALVLLCGLLPVSVFITEARSSAPDFNTYNRGNPYPYSNGNCTWYAWGRIREMFDVSLPSWGNARDWYDNADRAGFSRGREPRIGAIACWGAGTSPYQFGHVAVVERIEGNTVTVSSSNWGGPAFEIRTVSWFSSVQPFLGYIYISDEPATAPSPSPPASSEPPEDGLSNWSDWSTDKPVASDTVEVQEQIQYRIYYFACANDGRRSPHWDVGCTLCGATIRENSWNVRWEPQEVLQTAEDRWVTGDRYAKIFPGGDWWFYGINSRHERTVYRYRTLLMIPPPEAPNLHTANAWARTEIQSAFDKGFIPTELQNNYRNDIRRGEFARLAMSYLRTKLNMTNDQLVANFATNPTRVFTDVPNDSCLQAAGKLGITSGTGGTEPNRVFGDGLFDREMAAFMLRRVHIIVNGGSDTVPDQGYNDMNEVRWHLGAVDYAIHHNIMQGTDPARGIFSPRSNFTREQSLATFDRMG